MNESILSTIGHTPLVRKVMQPSVIGRKGLHLGRDGNKLARHSPAPPGLGLVLASSSLRPLVANHEAVTILTYPGPPQWWAAFTSRCAIAAKVLDIVVSSPQLGAGLAPRDGGPASMNQSLSDGAARLLHRFNR